jgi:plastocyanin
VVGFGLRRREEPVRSRLIVMVVGAVMVVALAGCSSDTSSATPSGGQTASAGTLTAVDTSFSPSDVTTGPDGLLTVTNEDSFTHTFTMDDGSVDEQVPAGQSIQVTITAAGPFHCSIHPTMTGNVTLA